ncbi:MAG: BRO family protein, partial [Oscillospiraceae bacterium]
MNTQLQIFNNPQFGEVRVAGTSEQPLFCLADLCRATELTNPSSVKSRLDSSDVQLVDLHALNSIEGIGNSMANFITESGFYDVLLQSSSPKVKPFRKWVTSEVLPTIRKHGMYATTSTVEAMLSDPDTTIKILQSLKEERQQRQLAESKASLLEEVTREQAPKVLFANAVETSNKSCLVGELAKVLK